MKVPTARNLFTIYIALLVAIGLGALVYAAFVERSDGRSPAWRGADGAATEIRFHGPAPRAVLDVGADTGEAFFYGPLGAGECLPPIDVVAFSPRFDFHGVGVVYNFGVERQGVFAPSASLTRPPAEPPAGASHLQVCFPSGVGHEQALWIAPRGVTSSPSPFLGGPRLAPPPLSRSLAPVAVHLNGAAGKYAAIGDRTVFSTVGRRYEVKLSAPRPIIIELGEIDAGATFVLRDTLRVAAGEQREAGPVRWTHFRILLPHGGTRARLVSSAAVEERRRD